jgi:hypothetical protein
MHAYLQGEISEPHRINVWRESDRESLRARPPGAGSLTLFPGDIGRGEFSITPESIKRCAELFLRLEQEFDLCLVDLSAGRSYAAEMVLTATVTSDLAPIQARWLVFHRWTRQHVIAASGLVFGDRGLLEGGVERGHDRQGLADSIRFVRTAVVNPKSSELAGLRATQLAWLDNCDRDLHRLAREHRLGRTAVLATVPLDPVLQWREQLISDQDVWSSQIANKETVEAFNELAKRIVDEDTWKAP